MPHSVPHAVLVTGASTGIGRCVTERLAALGHHVYATARKEADLGALRGIDGVTPVELDVRDPAAIERAVELVRRSGRGLWGLVNNAGIGGIGPIATWSDPEIETLFSVNALGPIRMARAFLPLLLEAHGRVVNVGSQGGSISKKYFGPYTMTKHALEAFTVALADEVVSFGVHVSIVQPGGVATAIGKNALAGDIARFRRAPAPFDAEGRAIAEALDQIAAPPEAAAEPDEGGPSAPGEPDGPNDEPESEANRKPSPPDLVADAILDALFSPQPRRRYLVGTRWEGDRVIDTLLERLADANACPSLGYTREELIARLEQALGAASG